MKRYFTSKIVLLALSLCCIGFESYATAWSTGISGDVNTLSNWTNGTTSPTTFATPGDRWTITQPMTMSATATWTVGTASAIPDTLFFISVGSLSITGAGATATINVYGDLNMNGTYTLMGAGGTPVINIYGDFIMGSGTFNPIGAGNIFTINTHGNFTMSGGSINLTGATTVSNLNMYGNCSFSGASAISYSGAGASSNIHFSLPATLGTMLIDNTGTGAWSGTNAYVDAHCTAQLGGNFSTMGGPSYGLTVNGTLICSGAMVNGTGIFNLSSAATLEVGTSAAGINGFITNTGTKTFSPSANYVFNGIGGGLTGTYLPTVLVAPDTITINVTGPGTAVLLSQVTSTTGTLLFRSGCLDVGSWWITVPGIPSAVIGAGPTSYVIGTLIKPITGFTSVNFEVGDADYAPMLITLSSVGTGGSLGVRASSGLLPSPYMTTSGISTAHVVNQHWLLGNNSAAGPTTIFPKATYDFADIIGGTNDSFVAKEFLATTWSPTIYAATNTSSPYTSAISFALATLSSGFFVFGNLSCSADSIMGGSTVCAGATTSLTDSTAGGIWSSSSLTVATIGSTGMVTGVSAGTDEITYTDSTCSVTTTITVNPAPNPGIIKGKDTVCVGYTIALTDTVSGGAWTSGSPAIAMIGTTGIVLGVAAGHATISYTVSNDCGTKSDTFQVKVLTATLGYCTRVGVSMVNPTTTELQLFPNPNTGQFTMNLSSEYDEAVQVAVTNIVGEKVKEFTSITNKETTITLNAAPGIYLLMATTEHGRFVAKVVIK